MDLWQKARTFAEEAARRSQELTKEAAKRSSELTVGSSKLSDIVSEASKRSKEIVAGASKRAEQIRIEAVKRADQIKSLAENIAPQGVLASQQQQEEDLEKFGITEELREFVKGITIDTFEDFPLEDDLEMSDVPTESNVQKDLNEWQEKHATLVLSKVKEISKLRYELCPRAMKERKFWRIYFILVNNHVAAYEKLYMEHVKLKSKEEVKDDRVEESSKVEIIPISGAKESNELQHKASTASTREEDLDIFLLGGDSDEGPDDGDEVFDDDFDRMADSSDDEKEKSEKISEVAKT
ncbi:uncharacterized protein LOC123195922 isoform X2 [Mangifera indica]|uniref:uncharacterized protein LOC123195922 isoform X2 n=1 Tax=Mangifera indica TaxID=29780 RepID=UPI001CFB7A2D|nr:uncharacterized protein LOC123195922 isoform X2 [Mangifera indica]